MKGLVDVWRERNPEGRVFSRRQVVRGVLKQSRIDLVLSTKGIAGRTGRIDYKVTYSDHMVFGFSFSLGQGVETPVSNVVSPLNGRYQLLSLLF